MRPSFCIYLAFFGFRYAMRDRLRAASCASEMVDQIGGWSSGKVGEGYAEGYKFESLLNFMLKI